MLEKEEDPITLNGSGKSTKSLRKLRQHRRLSVKISDNKRKSKRKNIHLLLIQQQQQIQSEEMQRSDQQRIPMSQKIRQEYQSTTIRTQRYYRSRTNSNERLSEQNHSECLNYKRAKNNSPNLSQIQNFKKYYQLQNSNHKAGFRLKSNNSKSYKNGGKYSSCTHSPLKKFRRKIYNQSIGNYNQILNEYLMKPKKTRLKLPAIKELNSAYVSRTNSRMFSPRNNSDLNMSGFYNDKLETISKYSMQHKQRKLSISQFNLMQIPKVRARKSLIGGSQFHCNFY